MNNSDNVQWINKTTYRIFDFLGFKNQNSMHKDLWGFKVRYFNAIANGNSSMNDEENNESELNKTIPHENKTVNRDSELNKTIPSKNESVSIKKTQKNITETENKSSIKKENPNSSIKSLELKTANPTNLLVVVILLIIMIVLVKRHI